MSAPSPLHATRAEAEAAYRQVLWTIIGHGIFFVVCCVVAVLARRMFKMPPALLTVAFFVALGLFGGDLWRFIRCRRSRQRWREKEGG
jgi:cell division protein FtsW (lipid II flippase)